MVDDAAAPEVFGVAAATPVGAVLAAAAGAGVVCAAARSGSAPITMDSHSAFMDRRATPVLFLILANPLD